ncbi:hypothetical protein K503DRAFT_166253 [Rhizopogon vinicolor AM-OR11-026]|uniref:Uncharacterized protein n=1 Tax=Rhizopogon vinicolor AM-OR11-026 TaxID=1314800 RepID=A0A1B7N0F3_9AGAM|nr:hypothetical protein K503DRAFT_166253 [Rhizopogon vinicolor AM-OR11-026]
MRLSHRVVICPACMALDAVQELGSANGQMTQEWPPQLCYVLICAKAEESHQLHRRDASLVVQLTECDVFNAKRCGLV